MTLRQSGMKMLPEDINEQVLLDEFEHQPGKRIDSVMLLMAFNIH